MNADAWEAILELRERAKAYRGTEPEHYVFPACCEGFRGEESKAPRRRRRWLETIDPTRPISSWRTAWRSLTKEAGLAGLRFHDLRHHAITELIEAGVPDQVIREIAGHVSPRMLAHYSHVRQEAKRKGLDALSGGAKQGLRHKPRHNRQLMRGYPRRKWLKEMVGLG